MNRQHNICLRAYTHDYMAGRGNGNGNEMYRDVSWMTPSDRPILRELADVAPRWQKPATMALNLPYARYTIAERCKLLAEKGLAERKGENVAAYRITELGEMFLADKMSASELEDL